MSAKKLKLTWGQIEELRKWEDEAYCKAAVTQNGDALRYVRTQTPEICKAAVTQDGDALRYVRTQTPEMVAIALKRSPDVWRYIAKTIYDTVTVEPPPQPEPAPKRCDKCGHTIEE